MNYLGPDGKPLQFFADPKRCRLLTADTACLDGRIQRYACVKNNEDIQVWWQGEVYTIPLPSARKKRKDKAASGGFELFSQMPGTILKLLVQQGDKVSAGTPLLLMESMKMEMSLQAPADGNVEKIFYKAGERVDRGALLVQLSAEPSGESL